MSVIWEGEHQLLDKTDEKEEFVARLTQLGYSADEFRVVVRRIPVDEPEDMQVIRYNVFVDQMRNGLPYRGATFVGGHAEAWVGRFAELASQEFPRT